MTRTSIGASIPTFGRPGLPAELIDMAKAVEDHGFDEIWVGDHVALNVSMNSDYPYIDGGKPFFGSDAEWLEATVAMGAIAAATSRVRLGIGACVVALRPPVLLAKQIATLDVISDGRMSLALGAGWLAEEYEALGVPWKARGARLDAALEVMRQCWTGAPVAGEYGPYVLPEGVRCYPTPSTNLQMYGAGNSPAALRRAATLCDGWYGAAKADAESLDMLQAATDALDTGLGECGRDATSFTRAMNLAVSAQSVLADGGDALVEFVEATRPMGIERIVLGFGWPDLERGTNVLATIAKRLDELTSEWKLA